MIIKRGCNNNKYNDLEIEIKKTLKIKTTTVPVVIGALTLLKMGTENYISKIRGTGGHYPASNQQNLRLP